MSDNEPTVTERIEQTRNGNQGNADSLPQCGKESPQRKTPVPTNEGVKVTCKSKRGTGTRDQDEVTVVANYDDVNEAYNDTIGRTNIVRQQMKDLRQMDNDGVSV